MIQKNYGFQSQEVVKAIDLIKMARDKDHAIFLSFTGNMISSGLRSLICDLCKERKIEAVITNGAGVEEDIIKTFGDYIPINFDDMPEELLEKKIYRIGNVGVGHELYDKFELFLCDYYKKAIELPDCDQTPGSISRELGNIRNDPKSFLYWAKRNNIEVFCPTFHDGAFGDFFVDYREQFPDYRVDFLYENVKLTRLVRSFPKCGAVILGGGTPKHFTLNNSILRGGYDWTIRVSTSIPFDGSDSGGDSNEARSWGKLRLDGAGVEIFADATLVFPMIVKHGFEVGD